MYKLFIAGTRFPVPPAKITLKTKSKNETVTLVNESEVNLIKAPGLSDIDMDLLLPAVPYHFAVYPNGFQMPQYYLELFEYLKVSESYFSLDLYREFPNGEQIDLYNPRVTLEDYQTIEEAEDGFDITVKAKFRIYHPFGTKLLTLNANGDGYVVQRTDFKEPVRVIDVISGETLYDVCMREFGNADPATLEKVYRLNQKAIDDGNTGDVSEVTDNPEEWQAGGYATCGKVCALIDKAFGGNKSYQDDREDKHWAAKYIISLHHKFDGALQDVDGWIENADGQVSQAQLMALVDKVTGGVLEKYINPDPPPDHWGRNHLNSLCDKVFITEPEKWQDFDGPVYNENVIALVNKSLMANCHRYNISNVSRLRMRGDEKLGG